MFAVCAGLGLCIASALAAKGARLALVDLNQEKLDEAVATIEASGGSARSYIANVADEGQVESLFRSIASDFGQLHGVVTNAGILRDGLLVKAKDGKITGKMALSAWQPVPQQTKCQ